MGRSDLDWASRVMHAGTGLRSPSKQDGVIVQLVSVAAQ